MNQPPTAESRPGEVTSAGYWDRHWQSRRDLRRVGPRDGFYGRNGILMKVLRERIGPLQRARIAELGAGSSYRLLALARWTQSRATGVDYSPEGIESLKAIFAAHGMRIDTVLGDVLTFEPTGTFDLIVHWGLLEHFTDPAPLIRHSARMTQAAALAGWVLPIYHRGARWLSVERGFVARRPVR